MPTTTPTGVPSANSWSSLRSADVWRKKWCCRVPKPSKRVVREKIMPGRGRNDVTGKPARRTKGRWTK